MKRAITISCVFLLGLVLSVPFSFAGGGEPAKTGQKPWSGYWWALKKCELLEGYKTGELAPMQKYDQYAYGYHPGPATQESYTKQYNCNKSADSWWGLCNGWAAASIMTQEPTIPCQQGSSGGGKSTIVFNVGDQKGLLTESWYNTTSDGWFQGKRYNGNAGDDYQDLYPDQVWKLLSDHVGQGVNFVFDLSASESVWNYPVYDYDVQCSSAGGSWYNCQMYIECADDGVYADFVGTQKVPKNYTFKVQAQNGSVVMGTGQWTGNSQEDHPDFAWGPGSKAAPRNTKIDYTKVQQICSCSGGISGGGGKGEPVPMIWANGYGGSVNVAEGANMDIAVALDAGSYAGAYADWWIYLYWRELDLYWPFYAFTDQLASFGAVNILYGWLYAGTYDFYFAVDTTPDGVENVPRYYDVVTVYVNGGPPGKPVLISPSGWIDTNPSPTFSWYAVSGATWYYIYIYDYLAGGVKAAGYIAASAATVGDECYVTAGNIGYGIFYWWVIAYNANGFGPWSDGLEFSNVRY